MNWLTHVLQQQISEEDTCLDLGCGLMTPTDTLKCKAIMGVDVFRPYLEKIKNEQVVMQIDLNPPLANFLDNSFDVVLLLDVVEHFELKEAEKLIGEAERIARKKVIVYTPSEQNWTPQDLDESGRDAWGFKNEYQKHKCVVTEEFMKEKEYKVMLIPPDFNLYAVKCI